MRPLNIIAVLDGRLGHEKQTRGIIEALGRQTPLETRYRTLPSLSMAADIRNWLTFLAGSAWVPGTGPRETADLVIGTGAHTHIPLLMLKRETGARTVTCMSPFFLIKNRMDLCCIPGHDRPRPAANVFITTGPPSTARSGNAGDPQKGLILVGGIDDKSHTWDTSATLEQINTIIRRHPQRRWTISSSPRTPADTIGRLVDLADNQPGATFFRSQDTPAGWIETQYSENETAWVTADSISMVYEALTAGCRVGILPVRWKEKDNKFQRSIDDLVREQWATEYDQWRGGEKIPEPAAPLDEATRCARTILQRWWPERLR